MIAPVRIVHLLPSFEPGTKETRIVRLMNALGKAAHHTVVTATPGVIGARAAIAPGIAVRFPDHGPALSGRPSAARYLALAQYMRSFDLALSYNWGAIDAVMARRIHGGPPLVHHEDGFGPDEAVRLKFERNLYRRMALPAAAALVVPSSALADIARSVWKQPAERVHLIRNGIDTRLFAGRPDPRAIPGFVKRHDDLVIGCIAALQPVKDIPRLVRAAATLDQRTHLVIIGEGPERAAIVAAASAAGLANRVHLPGALPRPERFLGLFDIFALASRREQAPVAVVQAMAAGLPIVAPEVGDLAAMVSPDNRALIGDDLVSALARLASDRALRKAVGTANARWARDEHDEKQMIERYRALYRAVSGRTETF